MGDTQIQYSSLLEWQRQRHACKQLGFRVVLLPEARKVTRHWSALGKCISTSNATGSDTIGNEFTQYEMVHGLSLGAISWRPYKMEKEIFRTQCSLQLIEMTMIGTVAVVCFSQ